jgi:hypothetical protein
MQAPHFTGIVTGLILCFCSTGGLLAEEESRAPSPELVRTWTASVQAGFTNTFQLTLGGYFGEGWNFQNRASLSVNNALRDGDSLSFFGWSTTDMPSRSPNWQAGLTYKARVFAAGKRSLSLTGGIQRWVFPIVKTGAKDWLASGNLSYSTSVHGIPVAVVADSWSLISSTLPTGSGLYTQVYGQHKILHRQGFNLFVREGPMYTYSWGFYGANGNRVFRYSGALVAAWKNTSLEAGCRQQFGLQDGIHYNRFWSIMLTRQITRPFSKGN